MRRVGPEPGRDDRDLPYPGGVGGRRLQDPPQVRRRVLRPHRLDVRGGGTGGREAAELDVVYGVFVAGTQSRSSLMRSRRPGATSLAVNICPFTGTVFCCPFA